MHFPASKNRRARRGKPATPAGALRSRRNAVVELSGDRERRLEMLFMAICSGDTEELEQILRSGSSSNYGDASSDLLNCACATGNATSVRLLLQNGIPFQSVGGKGDAPLHTVVRRGSMDIVKLLLDYGADVNVETKSERRTPLHLASASKKLDVMRILLENEAEVDKVDIYGSTSLHLAAEIGFSNGVGALIEFHADPNIFNRDGWTALHLAAANGHLSVTEQLIAAHATVDCQNRFGKTPLHWACARGHLQVARLLLKHNASIEVRDKQDRTAFDHAVTRELRNLLDATSSSVSNLSVIPRISCGMQYVVGESTLRLSRASAFVDALERARWSSNISSDSGIDCPTSPFFADDVMFDDRRWSLDGQRDRHRRQRKNPIWSKPEGWRPVSAPVFSTAPGNDLYQLLQKNGVGGTQSASSTSHLNSTLSDGFPSSGLSRLWPATEAADAPQRSHSVPYNYTEKARQLGSFLTPIQEDDKSSVRTSSSLTLRGGGGGGDEDPTKRREERARSSSDSKTISSLDSKTNWRPPRRSRAAAMEDSSSENSSRRSYVESSSDSDSEPDASSYSSRHLTRDLEKILRKVSLASESDETNAGAGVHSSNALIGAMNSGLKQLLSQLEAVREEEGSNELFSEA